MQCIHDFVERSKILIGYKSEK